MRNYSHIIIFVIHYFVSVRLLTLFTLSQGTEYFKEFYKEWYIRIQNTIQ